MATTGIRGFVRPLLDANNIPDEMYALKDENLVLKRRVNDQDEKTKQLVTKVQRLTEDLKRAKDFSGKDGTSRPVGAASRALISRREAAEVDDMVDDLRQQLRALSKDNSQLKNKMNFFKSLHEAETRKGMRYDHIPPRIQSGKRLYPTLAVRRRVKPPEAEASDKAEHVCPSEDVAKLEELASMLRGKLLDAERDFEGCKAENLRLLDLTAGQEQQNDIDRLTHQRTIADLQKRLQESHAMAESLGEKNRGLTESHDDAMRTVESLTADLKEERRRRAEIEARLGASDGALKRVEELNVFVNDLRAEKKLLEDEQARLLAAQFSTQHEDEWNAERKKLQQTIKDLESRLAISLNEAITLHSVVKDLREQLNAVTSEKRLAEVNMYNIQHQLDEMKRAISFLVADSSNGVVDWGMVRDAVTLWKTRNAGNLGLQTSEADEERRLLQDLRIQYARCIEDLERTKKLLVLQEQINKDYKLEIKQLLARLEALRNEYELRIEENARLLDLRANRISALEAQLKHIAYGPVTKVSGDGTLDDDEDISLENGQNLITIRMNAAFITPEGYELLDRLHARMIPTAVDGATAAKRSRENFTTFVYFDFFDHETAVGPVRKGVCPAFGFTAKYKLFMDDFCLMYLQSQPVVVYLCRADGMDFAELAKCTIRFRDLTTATRTDRMQYYGDLVSTHDHTTVIGRLDYTLGVKLPMAQTVRAFKERSVALNLMSVGQEGTDSGNRFGSRGGVNELIVSIEKCSGLNLERRQNALGETVAAPAVYLAFKLLNYDHSVTNTVKGTADPVFNLLRTFRVHMTAEMDRNLRTGAFSILVLDDSDNDYSYGSVELKLLDLARNEILEGPVDILDADGNPSGQIHFRLSWEKPYRLEAVPIVSQLEDPDTAAELRLDATECFGKDENRMIETNHGASECESPKPLLPKPPQHNVSHGESIPFRTRRIGSATSLASSGAGTGDLGVESPGQATRSRRPSAAASGSRTGPAISLRAADPPATIPPVTTASSAWTDGDDNASEMATDIATEGLKNSKAKSESLSDPQSFSGFVAENARKASAIISSQAERAQSPHADNNSEQDVLKITVDSVTFTQNTVEFPHAVAVTVVAFPIDTPYLDSPTVPVPRSGTADVTWNLTFPLSEATNPRDRFRLRRTLVSPDQKESDVTFALVSAGDGEEDQDSDAVLGYASFNLREWIDEAGDADADGGLFDLAVFDPQAPGGVDDGSGAGEIAVLTILPSRLSKNRKKRGHVSAGHGRVGKHRKHPGGRGLAGGQHHHRINMDMYHPGYFGKVGMRQFHLTRQQHWAPVVNVDKLWTLVSEEARLKVEANPTGPVPVIDVLQHGYAKVLGKGRLPNTPFIVKARFVSRKAEEKIVAAGGKVELVA
ncbi:Protein fantom [Geranomyces variabilis]|nr:Protein fantom [Geranomyces variabilis]